MTNPLNGKHLVRGAWCLGLFALAVSCGGARRNQPPTPAPTAPLPTAGLAGQRVSLFPLTLVAAEDSLRWEAFVADRRGTLTGADSVIVSQLTARATEISWVTPDELRRAARRSAGVAADPDQIGTAVLRGEQLIEVPDPLRYQMRTLAALAGVRFAVVPAALVYRKAVKPYGRMAGDTAVRQYGDTAIRPYGNTATAELSIVLVDVRLGKVAWRTVARGDGDDPWSALTRALKALTPGLP